MNPLLALSFLKSQETLFLGLFVFALITTVRWSFVRLEKARGAFNPSEDTTPSLENPIDLAFLAAGARRSTQVTILSLLENGALVWQPKSEAMPGRLLKGGPLPDHSHRFEKSLYATVSNMGQTGLPLTKLGPSILNAVPPVEGHLARLGLRPTE